MNLPHIFCQFLIFAAYAIVAKVQGNGSFSVSQAVTALTGLQLLGAPLASLLSAIPAGWASLGCFTRIQEFLLQDDRTDHRDILDAYSIPAQNSFPQSGEIELRSLSGGQERTAFRIEVSSFGWSESLPDMVKEVTAEIDPQTNLTICCGPVGCGKSTFLKGLLGETPKISGRLSVISSQIAYCDQTPWIISGSIRDNIVVAAEFDDVWYQSVVHACSLDTDIRRMPEGDATVVGSKGVKLSGGQKQRLVRHYFYDEVQFILMKNSLLHAPYMHASLWRSSMMF